MGLTSNVRIRAAEARDLAKLVELWGELARLHERLDAAFSLSRSWRRAYEEYLSRLLGRQDTLVLVAESRGELVGLAVGRITLLPAFFRLRRRGFIQDVYTRKDYQRQGVGTALVAQLETWMRQRGVRRIELTVAAGNAQAEAFWDRSGYRAYMVYRGKDL